MNAQEIIRTGDVVVRIMTLAEGSATEWHHHSAVSDFFVCLSGVVTVENRHPGLAVTPPPGQRTEIKPPQIHRVVNNRSGPSEYLLVQGLGAYDCIKE